MASENGFTEEQLATLETALRRARLEEAYSHRRAVNVQQNAAALQRLAEEVPDLVAEHLDEAIAAIVGEGMTNILTGLQHQADERRQAAELATQPTAPARDPVLDFINDADRYIEELKNHQHCDPGTCDGVHVDHVRVTYDYALQRLPVIWVSGLGRFLRTDEEDDE